MLYSVEDAAIKLNVSKVTIYNKVKLKEYRDKLIKKAGKLYLDDDLLNLIKDNLNFKTHVKNGNFNNDADRELSMDKATLLNFNKDFICSLQNEISFLRQQLQEKDKQLNTKDELLKNMQILIKQSQDKQENILTLEEHFKEIDIKISDMKQHPQERKEKSRSWIDKLFHRL